MVPYQVNAFIAFRNSAVNALDKRLPTLAQLDVGFEKNFGLDLRYNCDSPGAPAVLPPQRNGKMMRVERCLFRFDKADVTAAFEAGNLYF